MTTRDDSVTYAEVIGAMVVQVAEWDEAVARQTAILAGVLMALFAPDLTPSDPCPVEKALAAFQMTDMVIESIKEQPPQ